MFRGKTEPDGHWVYGSLISRRVFSGWLHWITYQELVDKKNELWLDCEARVRVKSETVGQYTGLKDKNGVKIFEGDIVKQHYFEGYAGPNLGYSEVDAEIIGVVGRDFAGTYTVSADGVRYYWYDILEESEEQLEVIGNRWDNPELLGVD